MTLRLVAITAALVGCSKEGADHGGQGTKTAPATSSKSTPPPPSAAVSPPPLSPTPAADTGFCEYTIDGGSPNRGGGGVMNVQSKHWLPADQKKLGSALLINCGATKQINLGANDKEIALGPATYKVVRGGDVPGGFGVLGPDFMGGEGELVLTAFDAVHVAGSFDFKAGDKRYAGTFDLKCPQPGNGICK